MKKCIIIMLVLVAAFSFTSCKSEDIYGELIDDITYENEYVGLGYTLPEGWRYYTKEELDKLYVSGLDAMRDDVAEQAKGVKIVNDMMAVSANQEEGINLVLERLSVNFDEESWKGLIDASVNTYEYQGYEDILSEHITTYIDGKEFDAIKVSGNLQGSKYYPLHTLTIYVECGEYVAVITANSMGEDKTAEIIENLYLVD